MNNLIKKAELLLEQCTECAVSSVTENGFPRVCILRQIKTDGIKHLWFATGTSSKKVAHYLVNPKAGVTFYTDKDCVTLLGTISIVEDKREKDSLWQDWMCKHYSEKQKDDPEYCVLRFDLQQATIYIDDDFETMSI